MLFIALLLSATPTCGPPWGSVNTTLTALAATDHDATVCADGACVTVEFATGAFTDSSTIGAGSLPLLSIAPDRKSATHEGKTLAPKLDAKLCVRRAELVDGAPYLQAAACDGDVMPGKTVAVLYVDGKELRGQGHEHDDDVYDGYRPVKLAALWAMPYDVPHHVDFYEPKSGKIAWAVKLPQLDVPDPTRGGCDRCACLGVLAIGGIMPADTNPAVATGDGRLVVVSPRGVALLDPQTHKTRTFAFPRCPR